MGAAMRSNEHLASQAVREATDLARLHSAAPGSAEEAASLARLRPQSSDKAISYLTDLGERHLVARLRAAGLLVGSPHEAIDQRNLHERDTAQDLLVLAMRNRMVTASDDSLTGPVQQAQECLLLFQDSARSLACVDGDAADGLDELIVSACASRLAALLARNPGLAHPDLRFECQVDDHTCASATLVYHLCNHPDLRLPSSARSEEHTS